MIAESEVKKAVGHKFPGSIYTIEHWENFLLTECTGAQLMQDGVVHPAALFHVPILGSGTSIAEMFALGRAVSDHSISIESYDWQMFKPLRENTPYQISGTINSVERCADDPERIYDRIQFQFEMAQEDGELAARTIVTWHYARTGPRVPS